MHNMDFHIQLMQITFKVVSFQEHVGFEQVLRALPAETMVDGLPRVVSCFFEFLNNKKNENTFLSKWSPIV